MNESLCKSDIEFINTRQFVNSHVKYESVKDSKIKLAYEGGLSYTISIMVEMNLLGVPSISTKDIVIDKKHFKEVVDYFFDNNYSYHIDEILDCVNFYKVKNDKVVCLVTLNKITTDIFTVKHNSSIFEYDDFYNFLDKNDIKYKLESLHLIENKDILWAIGYNVNNQVIYEDVAFKNNHEIHDEFYPVITDNYNMSVKEFIKQFIESDDSVLILTGEKGSGKTELIRHIIKDISGRATVTFNKKIINDSKFYFDFFSGDSDLLVIEDADDLIRKRVEGNDIMQLFLNLTDGLLNTNKKFIFTTNLPNTDSIDSALLRNGRCFSILQFDKLNSIQIKKIIAKLDLSVDEKDISNISTLADIFAIKNKFIGSKNNTVNNKSSFGFI